MLLKMVCVRKDAKRTCMKNTSASTASTKQCKSTQIDAIRKAKKINEWIGWSLNLTLDAAALDISGTTSETESVRDPVQDGRSEWRFWRTSEPDWTCISKCVKCPQKLACRQVLGLPGAFWIILGIAAALNHYWRLIGWEDVGSGDC